MDVVVFCCRDSYTKPRADALSGSVYTNERAQSLTKSTQHPENDMASIHTLSNHMQMPDEKKSRSFSFILFFK